MKSNGFSMKMSILQSYRRRVDVALSEYQHAVRNVETEREGLKGAKRKAKDSAQAVSIVQAVSQTIQEKAHESIASVVSRCLAAIFPDPYRFLIRFEKKHSKTEARLLFERRNLVVNPMTSASGGVREVAAFALRMACLKMYKPILRPFLILDEPFKELDENNSGRVGDMLRELCQESDLRILAATHSHQLTDAADHVIKLPR